MGKISPAMRQFLAIACCNLLSFSFGNSSGWITIHFVEIQQPNTTIPTGPFTLEEATFVATSMAMGGVVGNFAILPIAQLFGITRSLCFMGVPLIISNILIIFAPHKYLVYIARILSGITGGAAMVAIPSLIGDVSFDSVRGSLNSLMDPALNAGIVLPCLLANYFSPVDQIKILLIFPVLFVVLTMFLPQTPHYWVQRNKKERAEKSQQFYKGKDAVAHVEALLPATNETKETKEAIDEPVDTEPTSVTLSDFLTIEAKRSIRISFAALVLSFLAGNLTIMSFVTAIFIETGSALSAENSSIFILFVQISANLLMLTIVDRIGRRVVLITSSITTSILYVIFGVYCAFYAHAPGLEWVPPLCLALITFSGCMGVVPIPFILAVEIYPAKIRPTSLALFTATIWLCFFVLGSSFPIAQASYGLATCLFTFAGFCVILGMFAYVCMPETRGKSADEIMELLRR